jgi:hypothetical protein
MRYIICFYFILIFKVSAQQEGRIETDRPDQTECPFIVKKGYFQAEIGFNRNASRKEVVYFTPTSLLKLGVFPWAELRFTTVVETVHDLRRLNVESAGAKFHLLSGSAWVPRTALIVQYHVNNQNRDASERNDAPHSLGEAVFTMQHTKGSFGLGYNLGAEFHSNGGVEGIIRIAPNVTLGEKGYAYAEFFGRLPKTSLTDTWVDGGYAYYLTDNLKVDISVGKSLNEGRLWYMALGLSCRFKLY